VPCPRYIHFLLKLKKFYFYTSASLIWGSSGFAQQRNLKKICRGIRNSSNFSTERRNFPSLPEADFLLVKTWSHLGFSLISSIYLQYYRQSGVWQTQPKRPPHREPTSYSWNFDAEYWLKLTGTADFH